MSSALLVVDFQHAVFVEPAAYQASQVLARIGELIARARRAGMAVVYVQHDEANTIWERDSGTWHFPAAIAPLPDDYVCAKQHSSAFQGGHFQAGLSERSIDEVYVCGYASEFCLDSNIRQADALGIKVVVVADAHTTRHRPHLDAPAIIGHHNWIWSELGRIKVTPSAQLPF
jgi:nicotinamidase-related amidase